jgi:hypothetical protein
VTDGSLLVGNRTLKFHLPNGIVRLQISRLSRGARWPFCGPQLS